MDSPLLSALTLGETVSHAATVVALASCALAGLACFIALFARGAPHWLRADFAIAAVGLYAFAFGRLQVLESQTSAQIIAYTVGFILASTIGPVASRLRAGREPEE
jgi:hypothetical protein